MEMDPTVRIAIAASAFALGTLCFLWAIRIGKAMKALRHLGLDEFFKQGYTYRSLGMSQRCESDGLSENAMLDSATGNCVSAAGLGLLFWVVGIVFFWFIR